MSYSIINNNIKNFMELKDTVSSTKKMKNEILHIIICTSTVVELE